MSSKWLTDGQKGSEWIYQLENVQKDNGMVSQTGNRTPASCELSLLDDKQKY
jgi:hypothetical protein